MIQIPRIPENVTTIDEVRKAFNDVLAQIQDQINRDLNTIDVEIAEMKEK